MRARVERERGALSCVNVNTTAGATALLLPAVCVRRGFRALLACERARHIFKIPGLGAGTYDHPPNTGIGVFFNTRKGQFQYKISLYIIIYQRYIIMYHDISCTISCISCPSSTHDISIYHLFCGWAPYHVISCHVFDDIWT